MAFLSFCMALEAITSTPSNEITHILAERCALLVGATSEKRFQTYHEIKKLYSVRSKIAHGKSAPRRGPISWESLAITAKSSVVPRSALIQLLSIAIEVLNCVLVRTDFMALLHVKRSDGEVTKALNEYFERALFGLPQS